METQIKTGPVLTARQYEVLLLIAKGYTNAEIAKILVVTKHTVKAHICAIFEVLGTSSRVQTVIKSLKLGIINVDEL